MTTMCGISWLTTLAGKGLAAGVLRGPKLPRSGRGPLIRLLPEEMRHVGIEHP